MAAAAGCRETRAPIDGGAVAGFVALPEPPVTCTGDSLRPATAAPAEGLWVYEGPAGGRVAAMIGPPGSKSGEPRLTRPVATIETTPDGRTIRHALDTAVVRLELLPTPGGSLGTDSATRWTNGGQPAAVYAVTRRILLASYEPCVVSHEPPRLRYLRRDAEGRVVTDVILERTSGGT
jgi:hypothetical protein